MTIQQHESTEQVALAQTPDEITDTAVNEAIPVESVEPPISPDSAAETPEQPHVDEPRPVEPVSEIPVASLPPVDELPQAEAVPVDEVAVPEAPGFDEPLLEEAPEDPTQPAPGDSVPAESGVEEEAGSWPVDLAEETPQAIAEVSEDTEVAEVTATPVGGISEPEPPETSASPGQVEATVSERADAAFDQDVRETTELALAEEARHTDFSQYSKAEFVALLETALASLKSKEPTAADFKAIDSTLREVKPLFEQIKADDRKAALAEYEAGGETEEEFAYKADAATLKFESLYGQLRAERNRYFQNLDKQKDQNFAVKTALLSRLRALVEADEQNANSEKSWAAFKAIQDEWKAAGNIYSPHNETLWKTYHALVDRYFSNRDIYFELKELDRKRNMQQKIELCEKVERLAQQAEEVPVTGAMLNDASALFEEYKHVGPAPREANELLWQRFKGAMDLLYGKKRGQLGASREQAEEVYRLKADVAAVAETLTTFQSTSINEWNDKTKALLAVQDQWNAVKGSMPRDKGREISQKFWADVKTFFRRKGEFFRLLEAKRDENLKAKTVLCEQVEALLEAGDTSAEATNQVIEAQKRWKVVGHVPEKQRDKIFNRFKAACDAFFERKRGKSADTDRQFDENLKLKTDLVTRIERDAKSGTTSLDQLNAFKAHWAEIGYVPRRDMQPTQQRYIRAINLYVSAIGKLSNREREQLVLESEVAIARDETRGGNLYQRENDLRRRIQALENDISLTRNNLEFFARSKNSEKLRADFEKKIAASEQELDGLKHQLKVLRQVEG